MKKCILLLIAFCIALSSCEKQNAELREMIGSLENRISVLEKIQEAYKNKLTINAIQPTQDGYIIVFSDNSVVEITNGKDGKDGDTLISSIDITDDEIVFTLSDDSSFAIALTPQLSISLQCENEIMMAANSSREIEYVVSSDTDIDIEVLTSADLNAKICPDDETKKKGHILLITKEAEMTEFSKVIVLVSNGSNTIMRKISFTQEGMEIIDNSSKTASYEECQIALEFYTSDDYDVVIPNDAQSWISIVPEVRGVTKESVILQLAENKGEARTAEIIIHRNNSIVSLVYYVYQEAYVDPNDRPAIEFSEKSDREVLIDIYNALDGDNWEAGNNGWCTDMPLQNWSGVEVNSEGRVTAITGIRGPKGKIPATIGNLTELKKLEFSYITTNYIPDEISMLTKLEYLVMPGRQWRTGLTGPIPEAIMKLENLKHLDLSRHNWTSIPASISNLKNLESLNLHYNSIEGNIPSYIGELSNLANLDLSYNYLTGSLPQSLGNLTQLEALNLALNSLSGEIPSYIGNLSKLEELRLSMNQFSGQLPQSVTRLTMLKTLDLSDNNLTGEIPNEIGNLNRLTYLCLEENKLNGNIPENILQIKDLEFLGLFMNELTGEIPQGIGNLKNISAVRLAYNKLTGEIPYDLGNVKDRVWLNQNNLSGSVPESFKNKEWFKNGWGQIVEGNNLNLDDLLPIDAPNFTMYKDCAWLEPVRIDELYNNNGITVYFQWTSSCQYFKEALDLITELYKSYTSQQLTVISMTFSECQNMALSMPWQTYYNSQLFYPTYAVPTICVIQSGRVIWSDLIQNRKDLIEFVKTLKL